MKKTEAYESLCPVYGLAILNEPFEKKTEEWFHHYRLTNAKNLDKTLKGLELIFIELEKFKPQTVEHKKIGVLWLRFLREINENLVSIPKEFQEDPDLAMAVELAQESTYTEDELALYDQYLDAIRVEQTVRVDSYKEGKAEGIEEGLEKGRKEKEAALKKAKEKAQQEKEVALQEKERGIAKTLLLQGIDIETIVKATTLPKEEIEKLGS
jgi:predicted transposase/invertase (TIGR01784 family)